MNRLLPEHIETLKKTILRAGEIALKAFYLQDYQIEEKAPGHPVTSVDIELNTIIISELYKLFPNDTVLSEEVIEGELKSKVNLNRLDNDRVWILDPLDGTKDFISGIENFSISLGLVVQNAPVYGFIYNPAKKLFIHGGENLKITLNDDQLSDHRKVKEENIADLKVLLSRSEIKNHLFDDLLSVLPHDNIEPIGSIAYKLALLCAGEADMVLSRRPKSEWDIAGGAALLKELRYNLYDKDFNEIPFNQPDVVCNGIIAGSKDVINLYRNFLRASSNG